MVIVVEVVFSEDFKNKVLHRALNIVFFYVVSNQKYFQWQISIDSDLWFPLNSNAKDLKFKTNVQNNPLVSVFKWQIILTYYH